MKLKDIVPKVEATFGKTVFAGRGNDVFIYDPITRQRTNVLEARTYRLMSEVQGGEIEVIVPATVDELTFGFMEEVEMINPVLTARGKSSGSRDKSYAEVIWKCEAEKIRKKGNSGTTLKNTGKSET